MRREVINWHFDAFPFLQLPENVDQQLKVEGVGVVEVILVLGSKLLLLCVQHLPHKHNVHSRFGAVGEQDVQMSPTAATSPGQRFEPVS